jgi:hypothetical protein
MAEEEIWVRICRELDELRKSTSISQVVPPGWEPVDFDVGREWAHFIAAQGFYIECLADVAKQLILLKVWEYGEDEPTWGEV